MYVQRYARYRRILFVVFVLLWLPAGLVAQDSSQTLTTGTGVKLKAHVSEDGRWVAYVGNKNVEGDCSILLPAEQEIYLAGLPEAGGISVEKLTNNTIEETDPSISNDGSQVAFARNISPDATPRFAVIVLDTFTGQERQISTGVQSGSSEISSIHPMISGDGSTVVYQERGDIFVAAVDGSFGPSNITDSRDFLDQYPTISDDGTRIAFSSNGDYVGTNPTGDEEIFSINAFGSNLTQLTRNEIPDTHPWISGDGMTVAFERQLPGPQTDVFLIPSNGSFFEANLTNTIDASERFPTLNTSATMVAFEELVELSAHYVRMNADGSERVRMSTAPSDDVDGVNITLTRDGGMAAYAAQESGAGCRQIFLSGSPPNLSPLANGGGDQVVSLGDVVTLDGTGSSDANGDAINYLWQIVSRPDGSTAELDDPTSPTPSFEPDAVGEYLFDLTVDDGREGSDSDKVRVEVEEAASSSSTPPSLSTVEDIIDLNGNAIIDDDEIMDAITFWVIGEPVPGSDGLIIDDDKIDELITFWIMGQPFKEGGGEGVG